METMVEKNNKFQLFMISKDIVLSSFEKPRHEFFSVF